MQRKYTYIVGAGGSFEFGFPVGSELTEKISNLLRCEFDDFGKFTSGDRCIAGCYDHIPYPEADKNWNVEYLWRTANKIAHGMGLAPSIDNYLEAKKDSLGYSEIGKIAISGAILAQERSSPLWYDTNRQGQAAPDFARFQPNWLTNLFRILSAQKGIDGFLNALSSQHFITFNYDRVIEKFFYDATMSYFDIDEDKTREAMRGALNVVHVYGSLGEFFGPQLVSYGAEKSSQSVYRASCHIKTFTEGVGDKDAISQAKKWCADADCLAFFGFAFLPLNLKVLRPAYPLEGKKIIGTCLGMSPDNIAIAKSILQNTWFDDNELKLDFRSVECNQLVADLSGYLGEDDLLS